MKTAIKTMRSEPAAQYRSGFGKWYQRASVRCSPRHLLEADGGHAVYFPPELVPTTSHSLVVDRGPGAVHAVLVHRLHEYMRFTVELEAVAVVPVTSEIARGRSGLVLPERMCQDAFKITTDEAWHAQFSYDLMSQVAAATSIAPRLPADPAFLPRLARIREQIEPDLRGLQGLLFAVVSETLISRILSDLPHDERLPQAVREVVADHAEDEGRHHAYFRSLLAFLWQALDPAQRRYLGPWVPHLVWAFLEPDFAALGAALGAVGLTQAQVEQVLEEIYPQASIRRAIGTAARSTVRYFRDVGALDDGVTYDAFAAAGLLEAPE